ncbi:receptor-like protein 9DC3 [Manihot esculenta]|nr:receptor-like protein 9DC3 [Manihot esculenta]
MLTGRIPNQLAGLTFLQVLNLSHNQLEGPIPQGKQFHTFKNDSFQGNSGSCGFPLSKLCNDGKGQAVVIPSSSPQEKDSELENGFGYKVVLMGYGCGLPFGIAIGYIGFRKRKPSWLVAMVEREGYQIKMKLQKNARKNGGELH